MNMKDFVAELEALKITTPIDIDNDNKYYKELCVKYNKITSIAEIHHADIHIKTIEKIKEAIQAYYSGDLITAYSNIEDIIVPLISKKYICCSINRNPTFKNFLDFQEEYKEMELTKQKVDFFKARLSKNNVNWGKEDMQHIPFERRELASAGRFSVPGLPCIYLGKSAYICWIEMDKPADNEFYLSHINLSDEIIIFNLATNIYKIKSYADSEDEIKEKLKLNYEDFICDYLILWILSIATSFKVNQTGRNFKSEYIVSQLIMLCLKKNKIDGVAYFSKRVPEYIPFHEFGQLSANVAIMAYYEGFKEEQKYSAICDKIEFSKPINFSEFKQIKNTHNRKKSDNWVHKRAYLTDDFIEYNDTYFAELENYLKNKI